MLDADHKLDENITPMEGGWKLRNTASLTDMLFMCIILMNERMR